MPTLLGSKAKSIAARRLSLTLLSLVFFAALPLSFAASDDICRLNTKALLTVDNVIADMAPRPDNVERIEGLAISALDERTNSVEKALQDSVVKPSCIGDPAVCLDSAIAKELDPEASKNRSLIQDLFGSSCLVSGGARGLGANAANALLARRSFLMNMGIGLGALGGSYTLLAWNDPKRKFPFAILATSLVSNLVRSEVTCRNEAKKIAGTLASDHNLSWGRQKLRAYLAHSVWVIPLTGVYVGSMMSEDVIREHIDAYREGREVRQVLTREQVESYLFEGGISMVFDFGMNVVQVAVLDSWFMQGMKNEKEFVTNVMRNRVFVGSLKPLGSKSLLIMTVDEAPGYFWNIIERYGYATGRTSIYALTSDVVHKLFGKAGKYEAPSSTQNKDPSIPPALAPSTQPTPGVVGVP